MVAVQDPSQTAAPQLAQLIATVPSNNPNAAPDVSVFYVSPQDGAQAIANSILQQVKALLGGSNRQKLARGASRASLPDEQRGTA